MSVLRSRWIVIPLLVVVILIFCSMFQLAYLTTKMDAHRLQSETNNQYDSIYQTRGIEFINNNGLDFGSKLQESATANKNDVINALRTLLGQHATCMAIVDPILSRRFLKKLRVPLVPALYEATQLEWNLTELAVLFNRSSIEAGSSAKSFAIRQAQSQRLLPPYILRDELMRQTPKENRIAASDFASTPDALHWATTVNVILDEDEDRFGEGPSSITDAAKGVIIEQLYTMRDSTPSLPSFLDCENGGSSCEPLILEVNMVFGYTYILQVRDKNQKVAYWALRNGTTSFNRNAAVRNDYVFDARVGSGGGGKCTCPDGQSYDVGDMLDSDCQSLACIGGEPGPCSANWVGSEHDFNKVTCSKNSEDLQMSFVEKVVMESLSDVLYFSERIANTIGASWLTARWLIGSDPEPESLGPRLHDLKFFWYQDFSLDSQEDNFMDRIIEDLRKGFEDRAAGSSQRVASISEPIALGLLGCTKTCIQEKSGLKKCKADCGGQNYDAAYFLDRAKDSRLQIAEGDDEAVVF